MTPNDLRSLLIDCRIGLRGALPEDQQEALNARLEKAIREITEKVLPPPSANTKTTAQQVALAWQTVSRGLKLSHPELYGQMSERVMNLLNTKELVEPVTELLQLEEQVRKLEAASAPLQGRLAEQRQKAAAAQAALDELYKALAAAAPPLAPGSADPQALALQRLDALIQEASAPKAPAGIASGGPAAAPAAAKAPPPEGPVPSRAILEAVVAGQREFSKEQREWMIGECLALTAWEFTPVELIEKGDSWMAAKVLESPSCPA